MSNREAKQRFKMGWRYFIVLRHTGYEDEQVCSYVYFTVGI